jgi:hypothetical protein
VAGWAERVEQGGRRRGGVANFGDSVGGAGFGVCVALLWSCRPGRAYQFGIRVHSVSAWRSSSLKTASVPGRRGGRRYTSDHTDNSVFLRPECEPRKSPLPQHVVSVMLDQAGGKGSKTLR